ncbi:uncharacterized protein LOC120682597 isoform X2 [Panicum virgatum]|uniref:uncharacterized protein LOC120682597 isoform X2 n=1 Tax=Panicum virgatum TaxID=38727 RepID=UPI0019D64CA1|nr:uncharacterized protein LOC120682597 isoform X2 [Panicum virgatum]XP_039820531.1 uncharacterized protein LOC120682597 isoform X2 [Panicum virgatum]XP_039820539.1 uncharacterized protein LOC120682597 isoform X2 [Panicum virgatum]
MASAAVLRAGLLAAPPRLSASSPPPFFATSSYARVPRLTAAARAARYRRRGRASRAAAAITASWLDLTEDNVRLALEEAKSELGQLFDTSVGITGRSRGVGRSVREAPAQGQVLAHPRHRGSEDRQLPQEPHPGNIGSGDRGRETIG